MKTAPADWSFVTRPKWIASHLGVALLVLGMIIAGLWQIDRHRDRAERNDTIRARAALPTADLDEVAPPGAAAIVGEQEQFRRVMVTGEYQTADEVLVRNRTLDGAPGWWVLTPLVTDAGWGITVNRGWIPISFDADAPRPGTEAPSGVVTIEGWIQPARQAEGFQRADPATGRLASLARPDVERLSQQVDYELSPVVLRLAPPGFAPGSGAELPAHLTLPPLDGGPHVSYAVQWFVFTTIALVGYPLVLRRVARGRAESLPDDEMSA